MHIVSFGVLADFIKDYFTPLFGVVLHDGVGFNEPVFGRSEWYMEADLERVLPMRPSLRIGAKIIDGNHFYPFIRFQDLERRQDSIEFTIAQGGLWQAVSNCSAGASQWFVSLVHFVMGISGLVDCSRTGGRDHVGKRERQVEAIDGFLRVGVRSILAGKTAAVLYERDKKRMLGANS